MRFLNRDLERHFVVMQADMLAENLVWCCLACTSASLLFITSLALQDLSLNKDATWRLNLFAGAACIIISTLVAGGVKAPLVVRLTTAQTREVIIVTSIFLLAALQFLQDPWYGSRILQQDSDWASLTRDRCSFSDTRLVLVLSILVTSSHLVLPIRWISLLPLELALGFLYAGFAFLLGGPDGDKAWSTFLLFQGLIVCNVVGRRIIEDYQRHAYCMIIKERKPEIDRHQEPRSRPTPAPPEVCLPSQKMSSASAAGCEPEDRVRAVEGKAKSRVGPDESRGSGHLSKFTDAGHEDREGAMEGKAKSRVGPDEARGFGHLRKPTDVGHEEQWYVNADEFELLPQILGKGANGMVLAGKYNGSPVAVKMVKPDAGDRDRLMSLLKEVMKLRHARHPNLLRIHGLCVDAERVDVSIVLERVFGKTLEKLILEGDQHHKQLQPCDRLRALVDVSRALRHLHSRGPPVVLGDLKASNIRAEQVLLLGGFLRMKLLDFGLATALAKGRAAAPALAWSAPEVVLRPGDLPNAGADVFSFGRVAFFVLTGAMPLADTPRQEIIQWIQQGSLPALPWPPSLEPSLDRCRKTVELCLRFEAHLRPSMEMVGSFFESQAEGCSSKVPSESAVPSTLRLSVAGGVPSGSRYEGRNHVPGAFVESVAEPAFEA